MAISFQARRFISPTIKTALRRRLAELAAVFLAAIGLTLILALLSYHPSDPSFDTVSGARTANFAGPFGAGMADFLLQGFGLAGFIPAAVLLAWSYRLGARGAIGRLKTRIVCGGVGMPLLAAALAMAEAVIPGQTAAWPVPAGIGGAAGMLLSGDFCAAGHSRLGEVGGGIAMLVTLVLALAAIGFALGFTPGEWRSGGRNGGLGGRRKARGGGRRLLDHAATGRRHHECRYKTVGPVAIRRCGGGRAAGGAGVEV
jgi:S-DNA-T family DNA segregation ATPase FtsK/SpoIIIE